MGKENTAPADKVINERTKVLAPTAQAPKNPARRAFGVSNKVDVKDGTWTGGQRFQHLSTASCPARPIVNKYPVLTKTYTVVSSKAKPSSASHLKKQPNTGVKASEKSSSSVVPTAATKPNNRISSSSSRALLPMKTLSTRMSLGPVVQTKTGLIPAVTQPRQNQNKSLTHIPARTTTTSAPKQVRSSTSSSLTQRKTLTVTTTKKPLNERAALSSAARAQIGVQTQNRANSKTQQPLLHLKAQTNGLKTATISSKSTAAPNKPEERFRRLNPGQSTSRPTETTSKQRSEIGGKKNGQACQRASSSRCSSRPLSCVLQDAGAGFEKKTQACREADVKRGNSAAFASQTQTGFKRTHAPLISQTAPQPIRTISLTGQARKTPKVPVRVIPQTEGKKLTAVQKERM